MTPGAITKALVFYLEGDRIPTVATYTTTEPYAITFLFTHVDDTGCVKDQVSWAISREVLTQGLDGPAGSADFTINPILATGWHAFHFTSPDGRATLLCPPKQLAGLLDATYRLVPAGQEADQYDMDSELQQLLGAA